jgi:hypothetical protein
MAGPAVVVVSVVPAVPAERPRPGLWVSTVMAVPAVEAVTPVRAVTAAWVRLVMPAFLSVGVAVTVVTPGRPGLVASVVRPVSVVPVAVPALPVRRARRRPPVVTAALVVRAPRVALR